MIEDGATVRIVLDWQFPTQRRNRSLTLADASGSLRQRAIPIFVVDIECGSAYRASWCGSQPHGGEAETRTRLWQGEDAQSCVDTRLLQCTQGRARRLCAPWCCPCAAVCGGCVLL